MRSRRSNEYQIQADFIRYVELMHPDILYTISPAGFIMSAGMAMKMMRMGYRKGTPDVLIFEPRGLWHGLFIEFKAPGGHWDEPQKEFKIEAEKRGYQYHVSFGSPPAIQILESYLSLTAATASST